MPCPRPCPTVWGGGPRQLTKYPNVAILFQCARRSPCVLRILNKWRTMVAYTFCSDVASTRLHPRYTCLLRSAGFAPRPRRVGGCAPLFLCVVDFCRVADPPQRGGVEMDMGWSGSGCGMVGRKVGRWCEAIAQPMAVHQISCIIRWVVPRAQIVSSDGNTPLAIIY